MYKVTLAFRFVALCYVCTVNEICTPLLVLRACQVVSFKFSFTLLQNLIALVLRDFYRSKGAELLDAILIV